MVEYSTSYGYKLYRFLEKCMRCHLGKVLQFFTHLPCLLIL